MEGARKSFGVWLKSRHLRMLKEMPDVSVSDIAKKAIEELFEGRSDREYARVCIEQDLVDLGTRWEHLLGLKTHITTTITEDGFRVVMVSLKDYGTVSESSTKPEPVKPRSSPIEVDEISDVLDEWEDED